MGGFVHRGTAWLRCNNWPSKAIALEIKGVG